MVHFVMIFLYVFVLIVTKDFMLRVNGSMKSIFNGYNSTNQLHKANVQQGDYFLYCYNSINSNVQLFIQLSNL